MSEEYFRPVADLEGLLLKLSRAVEQSPSTIAITNTQGDLEYVNPKFTELTGYSPEEVTGKNPRILKSGDKGPEAYKELWDTILAGKTWRGVFHNKKKSGEIFYEAASISPIRDLSGKAIGFVKVAEDITERVKLEKFRDDLIHLIVHDLKNPLTGILSTAGLFLEGLLGPLTGEQRKSIETIQNSSKKLSNLISDILDVSRSEEGRLKPALSSFKVEDLLKNILWLEDYTKKEGKQLEIIAEKDLTLVADQNLLIRVLENLLSNAIKHTPPKGKITLRIGKENQQVLFEVQDSGEGIPKEYLDRIFEKFFKVENQILKTKIDTGLGLTFCKLAVEAHGGKIGAESEVGKGSRFYFSLPQV